MSMTQKRLSASFSDNPSPFIAARSPSATPMPARSEEHTSELQSRLHLVCRLLLEKKKKTVIASITVTFTCRNTLTIHSQRAALEYHIIDSTVYSIPRVLRLIHLPALIVDHH